MAPEQLEGQEADARTDIFALWCRGGYKMVTGRKAFDGKSQASLIGAILERDPPPVSTIQPLSPPALDRIVQTCLTKGRLPDRRWQSAGNLTRELQWIADAGSQASAPAPVVAPPKRLGSSVRFAWIVAALAIVAFLSALVPAVPVLPPRGARASGHAPGRRRAEHRSVLVRALAGRPATGVRGHR